MMNTVDGIHLELVDFLIGEEFHDRAQLQNSVSEGTLSDSLNYNILVASKAFFEAVLR
jgi:hypothetical protein